MTKESPDQIGKADPADSVSAGVQEPEAVSLPMLGRLFGVPFLIVAFIVGGAILVVFLFGGPAAPRERSVDELLAALENTSGEKSAGILLPREKELWQTALELGRRLEKKEAEFSDDELRNIATRLAAIVVDDLEHWNTLSTFGEARKTHKEVRSTRLQFVIRALGRTGRPESLGPLMAVVESGLSPFDYVAAQELGNLGHLPGVDRAVAPILEMTKSSSNSEALLSGSTVLSILADPSDTRVIKTLDNIRLTHDGEVAWSAALALTRLGSLDGKSTMLDLLARDFWESGDRYEVTDESGAVRRYPMPPQRIDELLKASIDAAAATGDPDLWEMIDGLKSDRSPAVRRHATEVLENRRPTASG